MPKKGHCAKCKLSVDRTAFFSGFQKQRRPVNVNNGEEGGESRSWSRDCLQLTRAGTGSGTLVQVPYSLSRVLSYVLLSCPAICSTVVGSSLQMPKSPTEVEL